MKSILNKIDNKLKIHKLFYDYNLIYRAKFSPIITDEIYDGSINEKILNYNIYKKIENIFLKKNFKITEYNYELFKNCRNIS